MKAGNHRHEQNAKPEIPGDPNDARTPAGADSSNHLAPQPGGYTPNNNGLLGIPDEPPEDKEVVAAGDDLFAERESIDERDFDAALAETIQGFGWMKAVRRFIGAGPLLVLLVCLTMLFMLTQALSLVGKLQTLPVTAQYFGYTLLLVLVAGTLWALLRLARTFISMRTTPRIPVEALRILGERAELRQQASTRLHQARTTLHKFLADYPLEDKSLSIQMLSRRYNAAEMGAIKENAAILLNEEFATSEGWIEQFDRQFLSSLDGAARQCIRRYAVRVGIKTAALPSGFDTAVILFNAYLMARDICVIYNLRTSGPGTAAILMRVIFNVFAAGQLPELTESAADTLFESGGVVAGVGRAVSARAAEGGVNSLLFMRLGAAMVRHLRPVWPPHK